MTPEDPLAATSQEAGSSDLDGKPQVDEILPIEFQLNGNDCPEPAPPCRQAPDSPAGETGGQTVKVSGITAGKAFLVFLGYVVGQTLGSLSVVLTAGVLATFQGANLSNPLENAEFARAIVAPSLFGGMLGGILVMLVLSLKLFRGHLREHGHQGAAWRLGTFRQWLFGFLIGGTISLAALFGISWLFPPDELQQAGPLTQMAMTPGFPRLIWFVFALLLAPVVEELLFRGIVFAGFRRWLGVIGGAVVSTFLFVLLHVPEVMYYWPAAMGITAIALAALAMRLRTAAVGPAVATHFAYNLVIALLAVITTGQPIP